MDQTIRKAERYLSREEKLRAMLRAAQITPEQLTLAAQCNDRDAAKIMEIEPIKEFDQLIRILLDKVGAEEIREVLNSFLRTRTRVNGVYGSYINPISHTERLSGIKHILYNYNKTTLQDMLGALRKVGKLSV